MTDPVLDPHRVGEPKFGGGGVAELPVHDPDQRAQETVEHRVPAGLGGGETLPGQRRGLRQLADDRERGHVEVDDHEAPAGSSTRSNAASDSPSSPMAVGSLRRRPISAQPHERVGELSIGAGFLAHPSGVLERREGDCRGRPSPAPSSRTPTGRTHGSGSASARGRGASRDARTRADTSPAPSSTPTGPTPCAAPAARRRSEPAQKSSAASMFAHSRSSTSMRSTCPPVAHHGCSPPETTSTYHAACRRRSSTSSPAWLSRSAPNSRIVSSSRYLPRRSPCLIVTMERSTRRSIRSTIRSRSTPSPEHTASAASIPKLPAKTLSLRQRIRSSSPNSS